MARTAWAPRPRGAARTCAMMVLTCTALSWHKGRHRVDTTAKHWPNCMHLAGPTEPQRVVSATEACHALVVASVDGAEVCPAASWRAATDMTVVHDLGSTSLQEFLLNCC